MKQRFNRKDALLVGGSLLLIGLVFLSQQDGFKRVVRRVAPMFSLGYQRELSRRTFCQSNLKQIALALREYSQDYDGRFPLRQVGGPSVPGWDMGYSAGAYAGLPVGWADGIQPHLKSVALLLCPSAPIAPTGRPASSAYTYFWFNANLSGMRHSALSIPSSTLLLGDGADGHDICNATYSKSSLPLSWLNDTDSPAYRHLEGANYLMTDGSVHWLEPQQVTTFGGRKNAFAAK